MATMHLEVTIDNQTPNTMTYVSGDSHLPKRIAGGQQAHCSHSSSWSAISNNVEYQIDPSHKAYIAWYIQLVGSNSFSAEVSPDDGRYSISQAEVSKDGGLRVDQTWTVRQH